MSASTPHIPVLIDALLRAVAPVGGVWLDGTFGAGGYARALLAAGADKVIGVDRDPAAFDLAASWADGWGDRLSLRLGTFSDLAALAGEPLDGVALDLGVSSMQIDTAARGFSFQKDGPLDMRMGGQALTADTIVNTWDEQALADVLYHYGEERASRRIARTIIAARPVTGTLHLAGIIARCLPRPKPGQSHPATRSFQALRIAVNDEYGELAAGLAAAERALKPGGHLAVVTFHSVEDRMVKRFFQHGAGAAGSESRHAPTQAKADPAWVLVTKKPVGADAAELAANPRARSALLRVGRRTGAVPGLVDDATLGRPVLPATKRKRG